MVKTIGNPLSWAAEAVFGTGRSMGQAAGSLGGPVTAPPEVRQLTRQDISNALRRGVEDFSALRSDVLFLVAIYPIIGLCLSAFAFDTARLPMLFPLAAGFALLGPVAAIGLYEMSRQREAGQRAGWGAALAALRAHVLGPAMVLGMILLGVFLAWMFAARLVYDLTLGPAPPEALGAFLRDVLTTPAGWAMIVLGMSVGAVFAGLVLVISLVSFPMLIDRRAGVPVAVLTSIRVARANPRITATWGAIVAVSMALGSIPLFLGLIIVLPILGHATWHLYRAAVPAETH